jgi:hypothetical protein
MIDSDTSEDMSEPTDKNNRSDSSFQREDSSPQATTSERLQKSTKESKVS